MNLTPRKLESSTCLMRIRRAYLLTFDAATQTGELNARETGRTGIHLHGHRALVANLSDALLLSASCAYVEGEKRGVWKRLSQPPVHAVGFETDEALLNSRDHTGAPFPLLLEYFGFPDKFDFVDVDLVPLARAAGPTRQLTLHLAIRGLPSDPQAALALEARSGANFKLFCTPVIHLFEREAEPIQLTGAMAAYRVVPQTLQASAIEV